MTIAQIEKLVAAIGRQPPMGKTLGFELADWGDGWAVFAGTPGPEHFNPMGIVHGGYAATLLDSACGIAVVTKLAEDQTMTTLELKTSYVRALTAEAGPVRARGEVISLGRRVAYAEAKLTDTADRLIATATATLMILPR